ncbi:MAG TPA: type VI secretion system tip protein TssI/VgrG [Chitinivibrionales bacterium]|nr:type VI secretion system tip protein TssI/VgrG [Chitinivibrionales bacterium]
MPAKKANQPQFYFFSGSLAKETFEVINFSGTDAVSSVYSFGIELISQKDDISADDVINKAATLYVFRDGEYYPYSGIVSEFRFLGRGYGRANYSVTLVPRLWLLSLNMQTRIFQKKKVNQIVKQVLDDANLSDSYAFQVDEGKYPELEYVVQYQESDLDFISRLMEAAGIWYFFKENPILAEELDGCGAEQMVITDKASSFEFISSASDLLFRSASGMAEQIDTSDKESVDAIELHRRIIPKEVLLKDFNYRTPEIDLKGRKPVKSGDAGTVYRYGGHFKNTTEADRCAEIEANRLASQKVRMEGNSNCRGMRAGKRFTLQEHFLDSLNGKYVLTRVAHRGTHTTEGDGTYTYANSFVCIPASQAELFRPPLATPVPRVSGIMTAAVEANGSSYAGLDDMGRYKVRMPFDLSNAKNYEASRYLRLAQPYAGSNYGMHFPSHEGAEMVWACIDGDPNRPLGLSMVPNANTVSPVVSANKQQNIIRTAGGNEFLLDDDDGKQMARLTTKSQHTLEMDDDQKCVFLQTKDKNKLLLDDKNECVSWNAKDHSITMTYKSGSEGIVITTKEGHVINIDDKNKKLTIQTKAGNLMEMDDDGKKIGLTDSAGKNKVTLDGNGGKLLLDSQGEITISASKDLTITAANIKMTSQGKIEEKATGDYTVKAMKISQSADMDVEAKAGMNFSAEGQMNATLKGGMQTKIDGMMTEVGGSAMAKVKGGIVMIN